MSNEKPTWVQCLEMAGEVLKEASGVSDPAERDKINHTAYAWMALSRQYKEAPQPVDTVITTLVNDLLQRVERVEIAIWGDK